MVQLNLIPGFGYVKDQDRDQLNLVPGFGYSKESAGGVSATLTGTATATINEDDVVLGGKTSIYTLTGDTFIAAGTGPIGTIAESNAFIAAAVSAQSETLGWNNEVTGVLVRTSNTVATITWSASANYDITAQETITSTITAAVLTTSTVDVVATPTFTVDFVSIAGSIINQIQTNNVGSDLFNGTFN